MRPWKSKKGAIPEEPAPTEAVYLEVGQSTDVGGRSANQDASVARALREKARKVKGFIAVADGMGGMTAGEYASRIVVNRLRETLDGEPADLVLEDALLNVFQTALEEMTRQRPQNGGQMGSTCSAVIVDETSFLIGHIGDCRAYLLRNSSLHRLTTDHSAGTDSPEQQCILLRAIGPFDTAQPDVNRFQWELDDVVMVCCDGVWQFVEEESMRSAFVEQSSVQQACDRIIDEAVRRGTTDNATIAALRLSATRPKEEPATRPPKPARNRKLVAADALLVVGGVLAVGLIYVTNHENVTTTESSAGSEGTSYVAPPRKPTGVTTPAIRQSDLERMYKKGQAIKIEGPPGITVQVDANSQWEFQRSILQIPSAKIAYFCGRAPLKESAYTLAVYSPESPNSPWAVTVHKRRGLFFWKYKEPHWKGRMTGGRKETSHE